MLGLGSRPLVWRLRDLQTIGFSWLKVWCGEVLVSGRAHPGPALEQPFPHTPRPGRPFLVLPLSLAGGERGSGGRGRGRWNLPWAGDRCLEMSCVLHSPAPPPPITLQFLLCRHLSNSHCLVFLPGRNILPPCRGRGYPGTLRNSRHLGTVTSE